MRKAVIIIVLLMAGVLQAGSWWHCTGVDTYAFIILDASRFDVGLADFSCSMWVKTANENLVFMKINPNGGGNAIRFRLVEGKFGATFGETTCDAQSTVNGNDNSPHHVVMTCDRDQADGFKLYVDGALAATADPTGRIADNITVDAGAATFCLNEENTDPVNFYIDQFAFYNGAALTLEQIAAIYNGGAGAAIDETTFAGIVSNGLIIEMDDYTLIEDAYYATERQLTTGVWATKEGAEAGNTISTEYAVMEAGGVPFTLGNDFSRRGGRNRLFEALFGN